MLHNDAILMMLHCHDDFECVCVCHVVGLSIKMIQQLPQTVDVGFVKMSLPYYQSKNSRVYLNRQKL